MKRHIFYFDLNVVMVNKQKLIINLKENMTFLMNLSDEWELYFIIYLFYNYLFWFECCNGLKTETNHKAETKYDLFVKFIRKWIRIVFYYLFIL